MAARALLRPKDDISPSRNASIPEWDGSENDSFSEDSEEDNVGQLWEISGEEGDQIPDDQVRRFCDDRFRRCGLFNRITSSTDSDSSYVPRPLKKLMKKNRHLSSSGSKNKSKSRRVKEPRNLSGGKRKEGQRERSTKIRYGWQQKQDAAKMVSPSKRFVPPKEESVYQKSASKSDGDIGGRSSRRGSKLLQVGSKGLVHSSQFDTRRASRKSVVEILLDPTLGQKEAERMVAEMHKAARDTRVDEIQGYLDDVANAILKLDVEAGDADDDDDYVDLAIDGDDRSDAEEETGKMDGSAMRAMLTALAGREAKEDAVASVANVGAGWRTVPHDQLNCCLSMDPKLLGDHRSRIKRNYEEFDQIFRPRSDVKKEPAEDENEGTGELNIDETPDDRKSELKEEEPIKLEELTREQMLEIHDKIGPWVHHHTKKLDKFIQNRKYTPQYLLNHWNGELSDDDSEVDFEKHRAAWKKKLEDQENPGDANQENKPPPIEPADRVPTLQENNWFLFPTPMTRSYAMETDEQGWDGQRNRPFSQVAMEGLVKHLKRQQAAENSKKFLRENPWPPPSRYPPEIKTEPEVKYLGHEVPGEEEEESKARIN